MIIVRMSKEDNKILKYNHGEKFRKVKFIICTDIEFLLKKMITGHNNSEKLWTTKISKYTFAGYSLFTNCLFYTTKNKLDFYRRKYCIKLFCIDLKEHATHEK